MKEIVTAGFFTIIILNQIMSTKFLIGIVSGVVIATEYHDEIKPYVGIAKDKVIKQIAELRKEAVEKTEETEETENKTSLKEYLWG